MSLTAGVITGTNILNAGIDYTSPPTITVASGSGGQASAQINDSGGVISLTATSLGSGYTDVIGTKPFIAIGGGSGGVVEANAPHLGVILSAGSAIPATFPPFVSVHCSLNLIA